MSVTTMLRGWKVLIVDDDPKSLEIARRLVLFYGAFTHVAANGLEGFYKAREVKPDFIITDIAMPVMDGWQMISKLKADPTTAHIPIIALTAYAMVGDREKALAAGCHNYLSKPLIPAKFGDELTKMLIEIPELGAKLSNPPTPQVPVISSTVENTPHETVQ